MRHTRSHAHRFNWGGKGSQCIKMICPRLHHVASLIHVLGLVVDRSHTVPLVRQLPLNRIRANWQRSQQHPRPARYHGNGLHCASVGAAHGKCIVGVYWGAQDSTRCEVHELHQYHTELVRVPPSHHLSRDPEVLPCGQQFRRPWVASVLDLGKIALLIVVCAACSACVSTPAPRIPSGAPQPYPPSSRPASPATVPADFPNPERDKRVCKQVKTDQGSKRVCMWEPRH